MLASVNPAGRRAQATPLYIKGIHCLAVLNDYVLTSEYMFKYCISVVFGEDL